MTNTQPAILRHIEIVNKNISSRNSEKDKLDKFIEEHKEEIIFVAQYIDCTLIQAAIFCAIFYLTITDGYVSKNEISRYLNCNPFDMLEINGDIDFLIRNRLVARKQTGRFNNKETNYYIPIYVINSICSDRKPEKSKVIKNFYQFTDLLKTLFDQKYYNELTTEYMLNEINFFQTFCEHFKVMKVISDLHLDDNEKAMFLYIVTDTVHGDEKIDLQNTINHLFDSSIDSMEMKRRYSYHYSVLIREGYLEFADTEFKTEKYIMMTQKGKEILFGKDSELFKVNGKLLSSVEIIGNKSINEKILFYNEKEQETIIALKKCLHPIRYGAVVKMLNEKNMMQGITVLFHGEPGTGKTESVYQLAKSTGRNILKANVSKIRDKYVGESEKNLKKIFDDYKKLSGNEKQIPILLFNESDSLFNKRINVTQSVDQMNNIMQNILLEELENFNGILFATTNLTVNLDKAFERRFLFKLRFRKPSVEAKAMIWKGRINTLTDNEALYLAEHFHFSGGEIENIARKVIIENIISQENVNIEKIEKHCTHETLETRKKNPIGFRINNNN